MSHGKKIKVRTPAQIKSMIMNSDKVMQAISDLAANDTDPNCKTDLDRQKKYRKEANSIIDEMCSNMSFRSVRFLAWFMHKVWKSMYDQIIINHEQLESLKELYKSHQGNIILCPTHRSYIDFLIVSYIMYHFNMEVPFICAGQDFLNIAIVHHLLR